MSYYHHQSNVESYIQMAEGYDGQLLIEKLREVLPDDSTVLELGMGPGTDFLLLGQHYRVTGSDYSPIFIDRFRQQHPTADVMQLDAVTMQIDRTFDCIYSNKVLYHLTRDELRTSLQRQAAVLNPKGLLLHSFWHGDKPDEEMHGLRFVYYTEANITAYIGDEYDILTIERYAELDAGDSFYVLLRKRE